MAENRQDAAQRRSSGGKGGSRSGGGPKKTGRGIQRAAGSRPSQASKGPGEAAARTTAARKSAAKDPPAKARIAPKSFEAAALRAAAGPPTPPRPAPVAPRRSGLGAPVFIGALLAVAGVVALVMILTSGDEENTTVDTTPPALTLTPGKTGGTPDKAQPPAEPAGEPATRTANCDPIIGSGPGNRGHSYAVTSTATDGNPADCAEARSVLLSALNGAGTTIGGWRCTTDLSSPTIASCTSSGGREIRVRG